MLQLNPSIPVMIVSKKYAKGRAFALIDYSIEEHIIWGIALDASGEVWWVPNSDVRFQSNWTAGRTT
jgi:hypothetical protein